MASVHRRFRAKGGPLSEAEARAVLAYRPGYGTSRLSEHLGILGPQSTVGLACASSSMAIIHAADLLRLGIVDRAVAGGFDGFSPFIFSGFNSIGALSRTACRPFDRRRDGTVLGEGAALVILETEAAARERGAAPLAEYEGGGFAADGVHLTAPDREGQGLVRAVRQALDDACVGPEAVDYINAHGTGTQYNDAMECEAFRKVFSEDVSSPHSQSLPPISSNKSIFGHTLGAAGALDAIVCIMALRRGVLPPTVGSGEEPEVEGWDFVFEQARPVKDLRRVLTTNSGFAGNNTAMIFRRPDPMP